MLRSNRQQIADLLAMLTYARPMGSRTESVFRDRFLDFPGVWTDIHRNMHYRVDGARILWSSHTDTVARAEGRQTVHYDPDVMTVELSRKSRSVGRNCLGADDTAGVWLMREMILARVPGHYVFHHGEERGGIGSGNLSRTSGDWLKENFDYAIALDRGDTSDIITSQACYRCASDAFAASFALAVGMPQLSAAQGVYTDTAEYMDQIPECSNISVGYYSQHSSREWLDVGYILQLCDNLCSMDQTKLVCERDPSAPDPRDLKYDQAYFDGIVTARDTWERVWKADRKPRTTVDVVASFNGRQYDHWCACEECGALFESRDQYATVCEVCYPTPADAETSGYLYPDVAEVQIAIAAQLKTQGGS